MRQVAIYLYDDIEVLDFAGPFEVFCTASRVFRRANPDAAPPFETFTVGATRKAIAARGGLMVEPRFGIGSHPKIDVLVIPGGVVTAELAKPEVIDWIAHQSKAAELTASVCTGVFLLAKAGLLGNRRVTTHWEDIAELRAFLPGLDVAENVRWVDQGDLITSAGISAGIDMSLSIVARLNGIDLARRTARQMDYRWNEEP